MSLIIFISNNTLMAPYECNPSLYSEWPITDTIMCLQAHQNTYIFTTVFHHLLKHEACHNTVPFLVLSGTSFIPYMMLLLFECGEFKFLLPWEVVQCQILKLPPLFPTNPVLGVVWDNTDRCIICRERVMTAYLYKKEMLLVESLLAW